MILSFYKPLIKNLLFITLATFLCVAVLAADTTAPNSNLSKDPVNPNGKNNWYVTPVDFTISATDLESGVKEINYRINSSPWVTTSFSNNLNLAPNPSMETIDNGNTPIIENWDATVLDADTTYSRDGAIYAPGYATASAKIVTTGAGWHGINNQTAFSSASPLSNMSASAWIKTSGVAEEAYFKIYLVLQDAGGNITYSYLTQSTGITGTIDWSKLSVNFVVSDSTAIGVYLDIGLSGAGTIWTDAVSITATVTNPSVNFTIGANGTHSVEYYSVDVAGNTESHTCTAPTNNCTTVKIDQNAPGNWHDAGAVRGQGGSDHELFVFANVGDGVSGISDLSNKYMYHVDTEEGFGRYEDLLHCNTPWSENSWVDLISTVEPGTTDVQLMTQKTDFCNNDWKICKTVRFYAEDMAGNYTTKDFCLNGPWIQFSGGGIIRANGGIDMISEPPEVNADGLVEVGNQLVSFFSTSTDWIITDRPQTKNYSYSDWYTKVHPTPTTITGNLRTTTGVYLFNTDYEITNTKVPNTFDDATFNQIYFINGNLKISSNVQVASGSTALFIVKGKVEIAKAVDIVGVAIFADGSFYTAYDVSEGQTSSTLELAGVFVANKYYFQRTLQGTKNETYPSEQITFEPKYGVKLAEYLGTNSVKWISTD